MEIGNRTKSSELSSEEQRVLEQAQRFCEQIISSAEMNIYTDKKHCLDYTTVYKDIGVEDMSMDEATHVALLMAQSYFEQNYETELTRKDQGTDEHVVGHVYELKIKIN